MTNPAGHQMATTTDRSQPPILSTSGGGRPVVLPFLALLAMLLGAMLLAAPLAGAASCRGKHATIVGGGNNVIVGTKDHDVIVGGGGNDRINGQGGHDTICGGPGDDTIEANRGSDTVDGGPGDDTIDGFKGSDNLDGGDGDDDLKGDRGKDELHGGGGNDTLDGGRGSDELNGDGDDDRLFGDSGNDSLDGGEGSDYVDGSRGDEKLVSGGPGDFDIVVGNTGIDKIDGGTGEHDIASYATSTVSIVVDLGTGEMNGEVSERLSGIEDVLGGNGNDTLVGNGSVNRLDGGPGDDSLRASHSGDAAFGGPGSDTCTDGFALLDSCGAAAGGGHAVAVELIQSIDNAASFVVTGTAGPDAVSVRRAGDTYIAEGSGGTAIVPGSSDATNCTPTSPSSVVCSGHAARAQASMGPGNDALSFTGLPGGLEATVDGGTGSDDLTGGDGPDTIYAGDDQVPDRLVGGGGGDHLFGVNTAHPRRNSGAATMLGGAGDDLLVGGQPCGGDVFDGGPGDNDSASFARIRNSGIVVRAEIGGAVSDPDVGGCNAGRIDGSIEKIEGSTGPDQLLGDGSANTLLGRGGNDALDGNGGHDRCIGGGGRDSGRQCELEFSIP
jgi:Ca2+-binding RTX toxin-like protein